jgi:hypothetical protein
MDMVVAMPTRPTLPNNTPARPRESDFTTKAIEPGFWRALPRNTGRLESGLPVAATEENAASVSCPKIGDVKSPWFSRPARQPN